MKTPFLNRLTMIVTKRSFGAVRFALAVALIPLLGVPYQMVYRNLLYTAVTRAQQCVLILGQEDMVSAMIGSEEKKIRYTGLKQRLEEMAYDDK